MADRFYVYEHRRKDTGEVFYVGKGSSARIKSKQGRNRWWMAIVAKSGGYVAAKVLDGLDEEMAHLCEIERIDQLRKIGVRLCNLTDGGEGMAGFKMPRDSVERGASKRRGKPLSEDAKKNMRGHVRSDEHRRKLSAGNLGKKMSLEARRKMSESRKGRPLLALRGRSLTEEHKKKISAGVSGDKAPFLGRKHTPESIEKIKAANIGRKESVETRLKKSMARIGEKNPRFGVTIPEEQKRRQIESLKARPRVTCPHCGKTMDEANAKRWHMDNCKERA